MVDRRKGFPSRALRTSNIYGKIDTYAKWGEKLEINLMCFDMLSTFHIRCHGMGVKELTLPIIC